MRAGWVGNERLQSFVRWVGGGPSKVAEVVAVEGYEAKRTVSDWQAGSGSGFEFLSLGGIRLFDAPVAFIATPADDGALTEDLGPSAPFDAVVIDHIGVDAEEREFASMTVRINPRVTGSPRTLDTLVLEIYRVTRVRGELGDVYDMERLVRAVETVSVDVETDVTFALQTDSGRFPVAGLPPEGESRPRTLIRLTGLQADGSAADNFAWMSNAAEGVSVTDSATYLATHYEMVEPTSEEAAQSNGTTFAIGAGVANMPEFTLNRASYTAATRTFAGAQGIADIAGTGELRIVARGEEWGGSMLTWEIYDGASWVECVDGDVIGQDNRETIEGIEYGSDLSGVPTTGPWDVRVTLTPSTSSLRSPAAIEFGVERVATTSLAGVAVVSGAEWRVDPVTLKANIPSARIDIARSGEKDYRDYGTELLIANHIGDIEVRVYVGDPTGSYLHRSEWMLHSVWEVEDYATTDAWHSLECLSPIRRLRKPIPPFVVTSGNDGSREEILVSDTRSAVWAEIVDAFVGLPARWRGPGVDDTTNTIQKRIRSGDAKDELDRVAFLGGEANIESQGRVKAVKVMRDEPGDYVVRTFPLGSYEPAGPFGPGFRARTDEYFVRFLWDETQERFAEERRYLNATALERLGGAGLQTFQELEEEAARWIITEALADAVGRRIPKHFGNGQIVWPIVSNDENPELEVGDVVNIETDLFVARSPINSLPIRGLLTATAVIVMVGDTEGRRLDLWVPGFEYLTVGTGSVGRSFLGRPGVLHSSVVQRTTTGTVGEDLETVTIRGGLMGATGALRITGVFKPSGTNATKSASIDIDDGARQQLLAVSWGAGDEERAEFVLTLSNNQSETSQRADSSVVTNSASINAKGTPLVTSRDTSADFDLIFWADVTDAGDDVTLELSRIEYLGREAA